MDCTQSGAKAYLVNTGWNSTGKRISIKDTRGIIGTILDGSILKMETKAKDLASRLSRALPNILPTMLTRLWWLLAPRRNIHKASCSAALVISSKKQQCPGWLYAIPGSFF